MRAVDPNQLWKKQPQGLYVLFFTELWERFSAYGLKSLLILYMTSELLYSDERAYSLYGAYFALVYAAPVIGGYLADSYLGQRRAIIMGGIIIAIGHFTLALPFKDSIYYGLPFVIVGTGFFKANIASLLGQLYEQNDPRRDGGFTLFYMGVNLGAFIAPLACGYVGQKMGWHYGFSLAGFGMLLGLVVLMRGVKVFPGKGLSPLQARLDSPYILCFSIYHMTIIGVLGSIFVVIWSLYHHEHVGHFLNGFGIITFLILIFLTFFRCAGEERRRMLTLLTMLPFFMTFFACFEQVGSSLTLFTERNVNRHVLGVELPASWFQSVQPTFIIALAPVMSWFWTRLGRYNPLVPTKFALALIGVSLGFGVLLRGIQLADDHTVSMIWLIYAYCLHAVGELCLSPVALSMVTKLSPLRFTGFMMGTLFLSLAFAQYVAALIAQTFGAPSGVGETINKMASLEAFRNIFRFLFYFPLSVVMVLIVITPFIRGVFLKHR